MLYLNLCFALFATVNAFKREHVHFLKNDVGFDDKQVNLFLKNDRIGGEVMDTLIGLNKKATTRITTTGTTTWDTGQHVQVQDDSTVSYDTEYTITVPVEGAYTYINHELPSGYDYTLTLSTDSYWVEGGFGTVEEGVGTSLLATCQIEFHAERDSAVLLLFTNTIETEEQTVTFTLSRVASTCSYISLEAPSSGDSTISFVPVNGVVWYEIETTFATGKHLEITFPPYPGSLDALHYLDLSSDSYPDTISFDLVTNPFVIRFGILDSSLYSSSVDSWNMTISTTEYTCHDGTTDEEHSFCTEAGNMHYIGDPDQIDWEGLFILVLLAVPSECHAFMTELMCLPMYTPCDPVTAMAMPVCQDGFCEPMFSCYAEMLTGDSYSAVQTAVDMCEAGDSLFLDSGNLGDGAQITTLPLWTADCDASSVISPTFEETDESLVFNDEGYNSASVQQMAVTTMSLVLGGYLFGGL